jgi:hypothetical protein
MEAVKFMKAYSAKLTSAGWQPCASTDGGPDVALTSETGSLDWCLRYVQTEAKSAVSIKITTKDS